MVAPEAAQTAVALEPKTKLRGRVVKTTLAGALVDISQELPGVIHISQLQKEPVNKVEDVVQVGQTVEVWVRRLKKDRIELTMIEPLAFEWKEIQPEMVIKGRVVRLEPYGAFVDFGAEKPGLVHVSELTRGYVKTPSEVVKEGDEVEVKVLDVDRRKHQIRLSMKALQPEVAQEKPPRDERRNRTKRKENKPEKSSTEQVESQTEPRQTAMQIAWQEALEKSKGSEKNQRVKSIKSISKEQEEILDRTLKKRVPTGG